MTDIVTSLRAEEELREIWRYIAEDSPDAADRVLMRIDAKLKRLCEFPKLGTKRDDIRPGVRMLVEGSYLLLYEHDETARTVELVSVVDGRRDLSEWF